MTTSIPLPTEAPAKVGATVRATINGREVEVASGTTILEAARACGVRIPTLCHHPDLPDVGVCRVCVVEVAGQKNLQPSCVFPITQALEVSTHTPRVAAARRDIIDLLLSEHYGDCRTCARNGTCELQDLAAEYGVDHYRFGQRTEPVFVRDDTGPSIVFDPDKCILCLRCVRTCAELQGVRALGVTGRGAGVRVTTFADLPLSSEFCINCGQCVNRCPTGALTAVDVTARVRAALEDPRKTVVIQTAPAPRAALGEEFGLPPGTPVTWQLNTGLRELGFDKVFDTTFAADLTIIEEGVELIGRLYQALVLGEPDVALPMFTSCSPGWVKFLEHAYPDYLPHLSTCKSPQQMFGTLIKTWYAETNGLDPADVVSVALMPCVAKKFEASRPEMTDSGFADVDLVLTARELAKMLRQQGIDLPSEPRSDFDDPFGTATGSGVIFGATGGVMEAALRTVLELVTGEPVEDLYAHADITPVRGFDDVRLVEVTIPDAVGPVPPLIAHLVPDWDWLRGVTLRVAVAHGTAAARRVVEDIRAGGRFAGCHFIEFMACPGGCLGGGGQPIPTSLEIRKARARAIYAEDAAYGEAGHARKSHENPAVQRLYAELLTDGPGGATSHRLLHTGYTARGTFVPTCERG
jgi:NADH-quinone oxidoreductase subunit G/[NiFe] hydrogenase diaphorase moiety small subunit